MIAKQCTRSTGVLQKVEVIAKYFEKCMCIECSCGRGFGVERVFAKYFEW